jgi:hypothetical protein
MYKTGIRSQGKSNQTGNFQQYYKTITQMKQ